MLVPSSRDFGLFVCFLHHEPQMLISKLKVQRKLTIVLDPKFKKKKAPFFLCILLRNMG